MSTKKISGSERDKFHGRMAEGLDNWEKSRKPKRKKNLVSYDWAARRVVNQERAAHKPCMVYGSAYRDNFDQIFRRNAK